MKACFKMFRFSNNNLTMYTAQQDSSSRYKGAFKTECSVPLYEKYSSFARHAKRCSLNSILNIKSSSTWLTADDKLLQTCRPAAKKPRSPSLVLFRGTSG